MSQSQESKADAAQQRSEETRSFVRTVKAATRRRYTPEEKIDLPPMFVPLVMLVQQVPEVDREHHSFGRWWPVAQRAVWPDLVVGPPVPLHQYLHLVQGVEDLSVQQLVSQLAVEALHVAVLPR